MSLLQIVVAEIQKLPIDGVLLLHPEDGREMIRSNLVTFIFYDPEQQYHATILGWSFELDDDVPRGTCCSRST